MVMFLLSLNILLTLLLLAGGYRIYRGTRDMQKKMPLLAEAHFRQTEALMALYAELKPVHALPPTRGWAASPDFLRNLVQHALRHRPVNIVECGSGTSTVVLAEGLRKLGGGHVYSLEHEAAHAAFTRQMLAERGLSAFATVIDAPLVPFRTGSWQGSWYRLDELNVNGGIDMLVVDGPPHHAEPASLARYPAVPALYVQFNPGAAVFVDDADRPGEQAMIRRWLTEMPALVERPVSVCEKGCVLLSL